MCCAAVFDVDALRAHSHPASISVWARVGAGGVGGGGGADSCGHRRARFQQTKPTASTAQQRHLMGCGGGLFSSAANCQGKSEEGSSRPWPVTTSEQLAGQHHGGLHDGAPRWRSGWRRGGWRTRPTSRCGQPRQPQAAADGTILNSTVPRTTPPVIIITLQSITLYSILLQIGTIQNTTYFIF